jgi:CheY-like chemotaxis protein
MHRRTALLIDDDDVAIKLIQRSLSSIDPDLAIVSVKDAVSGINHVKDFQFNIIISDLTFLAQDEDRLLNTIRAVQTDFKLIATAHASIDLPELIARLQTPSVVYKPIDLAQLNQVLGAAFPNQKKIHLDHFSLSESMYGQINTELSGLRESTNARCILVSDTYGRVLITAGDTEGLPIDAITSLLGGGVATLLEAGSSLDDGDVINLAYREGMKSDLYAVNIGQQLLLILVIDRGLFYNRLGTVWFYTRQTVINLNKIVEQAKTEQPNAVGSGNLNQAYSDELDRLFHDTL